MGELLTKRASKFALVKEADFGTDPGSGYQVIDVIDVNPKRARENIAREVIRNSFDKPPTILGNETVTYDISLEMHGSGTCGTAPESDVLWECALGRKRTQSGTMCAVSAASSPYTSLTFVDGDDLSVYKVNDLVLIVNTDGTGAEVRRVTAVDNTAPGKSLTLSQGCSADPTGKKVKVGLQYQLKLQTDTALQVLPSFYAKFLRGGKILEPVAGNKVSSLKIDFTSGQLVKPTFSIEGRNMPTIAAGSLSGSSSDSAILPHVARYMTAKIGSTTYPLSVVSMNLANTLYRQTAITTSGTQNLIRTGREVNGSFQLLYDEDYVAMEDLYDDQTFSELLLVSSEGGAALEEGNILAVCMPQIKFTDLPKAEDSGIFRFDVNYESVYVSGEDTLYIAVL